MKRIVMCLAFMMVLFAGASLAQTKTLTGTVVNYVEGNRGQWEAIDLKVGDKTYFVYISTTEYPSAKRSGAVTQAGSVVRVFYTRKVATSGDYAGDVIATKIVEIRKSKPKKR